jgi:uncharacterized membrane protein
VRLTFPDRFFDYLPWAAATLFIAGLVHLVSVLLMPTVAPHDAYARIVETLRAEPDGKLVILPPLAPESAPLPFEDAAFAEAVCLYDLSKGLLRVTAPADGEEYLAISFHARTGRLYHAITDRAAIKGKIDIVIGDERQIEALQSVSEEAPQQEVRVTAPAKRGFALVRSFAKRPSDQARARARLSSVSCGTFELPKE